MAKLDISKDNIKGIECKYVNYSKAVDKSNDDLLIVKEVVHTKDGQLIPRIRTIVNYQRDFYITKPKFRNHNDKKECEDLDKLDKYTCTQAQLAIKIQMALGRKVPDKRKSLRDVCTNPYVYLADITTPTLLKARYKAKWPDLITPNKIAVLDIETDVVNGTEKPILITVTCENRRIVGLVKSYADRILNPEQRITGLYRRELSDITLKDKKGEDIHRNLIEEFGGDIEFVYSEKPGRLFSKIMQRVHQMQPDFLAIWNIGFDIPKLISCLEEENIDLNDVFSDPSVPKKFRNCWWDEANAVKETNSKKISQHPADLWHVLHCQAGFYVIDAMALFKKIRTANGNEPSYSLDYILKKYLGIGKLKFKECDGNGDLKWHIKMQTDFPAEYVVYNIFDCMSIQLLDAKTQDLQMTVSALADISEYRYFPSLPKRLVDILTYFYFKNGKCPGSCGAEVVSEMDDEIISLREWIVTLSAHMVHEDGLFCIDEIPELRTKIRTQTADDDLTQAYPTGGLVMNISKETTHIELCSIEGVSESARRRAGINLTGGSTNAIEICNDIMGMPYLDDLLGAYKTHLDIGSL